MPAYNWTDASEIQVGCSLAECKLKTQDEVLEIHCCQSSLMKKVDDENVAKL